MSKDKKKNDAAKKSESKKQDNKAKSGAKNTKKGGPVQSETKKNPISWLFEYLAGVRQELKRVTWPTREKVIYLVGVVVVTLVFFASYTAIVDWGSSEGVVALNRLAHDGPAAGGEVPVEIDFGDFDLENVGDTEGTEGIVDGENGVVIETEIPATETEAPADDTADETTE